MRDKDTFSSYHPIISFIYFGLILGFSMFFGHPVCIAVSLVSAVTYSIYLRGKKGVRFSLMYMMPMMMFSVIVSVAFSHGGVTILAYFPSGNPLTLESIVYGVASATTLVTVITWFTCYSEVITSDKFVYLFGKIIPALSLVLSMTLRFVPKFKAQLKVVSEAQRDLGRDVLEGSVFQRIRKAITILSILLTWSLENAIETADSMRSRGYGLPGRSAFSIYRFDSRDKLAFLWLLGCGVYIVIGWITGAAYWRYFPSIKGTVSGVYAASFFAVYFALCLTPVILNAKEDRKWTRLQSKI
jgi:Cobalt transport protein.